MAVHSFNPTTHEAKVFFDIDAIFIYRERVLGQPGLYGETLSRKIKNKTKQKTQNQTKTKTKQKNP